MDEKGSKPIVVLGVGNILLKDEGVTSDTWDREAAGIKIKREKIGGS